MDKKEIEDVVYAYANSLPNLTVSEHVLVGLAFIAGANAMQPEIERKDKRIADLELEVAGQQKIIEENMGFGSMVTKPLH